MSRPPRHPHPSRTPEPPRPEGVVYGIHPVEELLISSPARVIRVHFLEGRGTTAFNNLVQQARERKVPFGFEGRARLDRLAGGGSHQGVVAEVAPFAYAELDEVVARATAAPPGLLLILDGVEDPRNLGAVLRSAEALGAHGVIIPKRRAAPLTDLVAKASAGAVSHLPIARVENVTNAIDRLKEAGFWVYGLDAQGPELLPMVDAGRPLVLVLGGEGKGLRPTVQARCDGLLAIPLTGQVASLNVSVAAAIAIFTVIARRQGWCG